MRYRVGRLSLRSVRKRWALLHLKPQTRNPTSNIVRSEVGNAGKLVEDGMGVLREIDVCLLDLILAGPFFFICVGGRQGPTP